VEMNARLTVRITLRQRDSGGRYYRSPDLSYPGLARNRSFFLECDLQPERLSAFSLEYRRLWTNYATGPTAFSDVIGIGAGYKF
jgi:hypothetical protein